MSSVRSTKRSTYSKTGKFSSTKPSIEAQCEKLKRDNELLKQQIAAQSQSLSTTQTVTISNKINKLNDTGDALFHKVKAESNRLIDVQNQVELLDVHIMDARLEQGGIEVVQQNNKMIDQQIKVLENRLDRSLTKFNQVISSNKKLRAEIENLREERKVFNNIYHNMEKELFGKKKDMAETIEQSNDAYEDRDEAVDHLKSLATLRQQTIESYQRQFAELDSIIKTDRDLNEKIKQQEKERTAGFMGKNRDEETKLKSKVIKGNWMLAEKRAKQIIQQEKIKQFHDRFRKIETSCNVTIEELIQQFKESEDANFSLFTYVNELNSEIELLSDQIAELQKEYDDYNGDEIRKISLQRKQKLASLQDSMEEHSEKARDYEGKLATLQSIFTDSSEAVTSIMEAAACDPKNIQDMLGTEEINENNLVLYLSMLEQRVSNITATVARNQSVPLKVGPSQGAAPARLSITPPTTERAIAAAADFSDDDDDDEDEMPLTREELRSRFAATQELGTPITKKRKTKRR